MHDLLRIIDHSTDPSSSTRSSRERVGWKLFKRRVLRNHTPLLHSTQMVNRAICGTLSTSRIVPAYCLYRRATKIINGRTAGELAVALRTWIFSSDGCIAEPTDRRLQCMPKQKSCIELAKANRGGQAEFGRGCFTTTKRKMRAPRRLTGVVLEQQRCIRLPQDGQKSRS